jgi:hypothetical protein
MGLFNAGTGAATGAGTKAGALLGTCAGAKLLNKEAADITPADSNHLRL